jgi:hypothetical protein
MRSNGDALVLIINGDAKPIEKAYEPEAVFQAVENSRRYRSDNRPFSHRFHNGERHGP